MIELLANQDVLGALFMFISFLLIAVTAVIFHL